MSRPRKKRARSRLLLIPWILLTVIVTGVGAVAAREYATGLHLEPDISASHPEPADVPAISNVQVAVEPASAPRVFAMTAAAPLVPTSDAAPRALEQEPERAGSPPATATQATPPPLVLARTSPYSAKPFSTDAELAASISRRIAGFPGKVGIAIEDLNTGRGVLIDPDSEFQAASLFKLSVMYEVYKQRELGTLSFDEALTVTERHVSFDLGTLDRPAGSTIRLGEALDRMITISDNSSAIILTDRVGAYTINQDLRSLGLLHTRLITDDLVTSPGDMLTFLEMLAHGDGVNARTSAEMIQLMARQRINDRIPRKLPSSAVIAHKTGNLPGVVNDVGIVFAPDASFIVAVLIDKTTDEGRAAQLTADVAELAYQRFRESGANDVAPPVVEPKDTPRPAPTAIPTDTPPPDPTASATEPPAPPRSAPASSVPSPRRTTRSGTAAAPGEPIEPPVMPASSSPEPPAPLRTPPATAVMGSAGSAASPMVGSIPLQAWAATPVTSPPTPSRDSAAPLERRLDAAPRR